MTDHYQNIAPLYDRFFSRILRRLREDIRTYIYHRKFSRIIDICCGTGEQLAMLDKPGMQLTGIDSSGAMLEKAKQNCSQQTELHLIDASSETFTGSSFDCAVLCLCLHEKSAPERQAIFTNARNLVREKGSIIVADYTKPSPGSITGRFLSTTLIPLIERCAGKNHFQQYQQWILQGGLETFLQTETDHIAVISRPFSATLLCCAITKQEAVMHTRHRFWLLDKSFHHQHSFSGP
ncbi:MAG: hypothetical protein CR981_02420 [Proteobacteria bacterium]|nr:MAG: hypothetical protein CR981_02420 [Pseudomonadota bacterium]PIE64630.1 MAG: hypothetical protein CSA26_07020 [Desulfobacterales bacterium]